MHVCGDPGYGYSTVCEEAGILVWRCMWYFQGSKPTYLKNLFVDEHIGMRSAEYDTPNCSYGNHRWHKCVVKRDELQLIHCKLNSEQIHPLFRPITPHSLLCSTLLSGGWLWTLIGNNTHSESTKLGLLVSLSFWPSSGLIPSNKGDPSFSLWYYS